MRLVEYHQGTRVKGWLSGALGKSHAFLVCGSKKREFAGDSMFFFFFNRGKIPFLLLKLAEYLFFFHFNYKLPGGRRSLRVVWRGVGGTQWALLEVDGWKMFFF